MNVTVVVPTRDRSAALAGCLRALEGQGVEVIVVDDASVDAGAVAKVVAALPTARLVVGEGRGPAAARNLGAAAAEGDVICFTDDDCRPRPGWAAALARRLADDPHAAGAAGPTLVDPSAGTVAAAAQVVTNHLMDASRDAAGRLGFAPTSNLAVRAEVTTAFPFDESFPLAAGEDREWCTRLTEAGEVLVHEPDAVVDHHPELDVRRFWRQQERYGRGGARFRASTGAGLAPLGFYAGLIRRGFAAGPAAGGLVVLAQAAAGVGATKERFGR